MHFLALLNRDSGTLRTADLDMLRQGIRGTLEAAGHSVDIGILSGQEITEALRIAAREEADVVMVGGGDGTVSAAAASLMNSDKALAILPAGTMNLFARGLGIPLALDAAVEALAHGEIRRVDIAAANGRLFVHQFSIGIHARLVQLRSRLEFRSRLGKLWASVRAAYDAMTSPPVMNVTLIMGETELSTTTTGIGISNNLFGEGHLPYADIPDGGVIGIYVSSAKSRAEILWLLIAGVIGRWQASEKIEIHETQTITLKVAPRSGQRLCVMDGELSVLEPVTRIEILPKALRVLAPPQRN